MKSRAIFLVTVLIVAGLLAGVTAGSVTAATSTTVTWKVSSLTAGQVKSLSAIASTNSPGVKTWSKTGSCTLSPKSKPTKLTMGTGSSCTLTLKIAQSVTHWAKTSTKTITRKSTAPTTTTTTVAPTTTTTTVAPTTTTTTAPTTTTTVAPTTTTTVAPVVYNVGDTGPGGGIIFYKDLTRAAGSQYFEAACYYWEDDCDGVASTNHPWGCEGDYFSTEVEIGTGKQNTVAIVTGCREWGFAAKVADDLVFGGQSDWFLPSRDEMKQMFLQRTAIGFSWLAGCWSSSELSNSLAWFQDFNDLSAAFYKHGHSHVCPVRSF